MLACVYVLQRWAQKGPGRRLSLIPRLLNEILQEPYLLQLASHQYQP